MGIPNIARTIGKATREFKDAANTLQKDIHKSKGSITKQINEQTQEVKKEIEKE